MLVHGISAKETSVRDRARELLRKVGLDEKHYYRYPHEFSGGQRQRVCIARALAVEPRLIVCDEAVSALDVSVQAQILNLLYDLKRDLGLAYLFITHDLGVVRNVADRVAVMYLGRILEEGPAAAVLQTPQNPYTQALMSAVPRLEPGRRRVQVLSGDVPSPLRPPSGCHFHTRCPKVFDRCSREAPPLYDLSDARRSRCFLSDPKEPVTSAG
jgi:oligopeptide/dipeptide ABC transporter ATP-binding protein